jgi:hypothetical protein
MDWEPHFCVLIISVFHSLWHLWDVIFRRDREICWWLHHNCGSYLGV